MICKSDTFAGVNHANFAWKNWIGKVDYQIDEYFNPDAGPAAIQNLVYVVAGATAANKNVRAVGSGWAFEDLDQSDSRVVSLSNVAGKLTDVTEGSAALTDAWKAKQNDPNASTHLVHVEAGIEIGALCEMLQQAGWAMPTLGGSNGQSIAGAISTSTHGGDWDQPPLADYVRAIHLITHGGQELWIERESDPIITDARLAPVMPCADTRQSVLLLTVIATQNKTLGAVPCFTRNFRLNKQIPNFSA